MNGESSEGRGEKKMGCKLAAEAYDVPATTLRRRFVRGCNSDKGDLGGTRPVFTPEIEAEFANHLINLETRFFGLTPKDMQRLVFEFAGKNGIKHPFNATKNGWSKMAKKLFISTGKHIQYGRVWTTVQKQPQKVLATKGRKQVGALCSAGRGQRLTVVCCMN